MVRLTAATSALNAVMVTTRGGIQGYEVPYVLVASALMLLAITSARGLFYFVRYILEERDA